MIVTGILSDFVESTEVSGIVISNVQYSCSYRTCVGAAALDMTSFA